MSESTESGGQKSVSRGWCHIPLSKGAWAIDWLWGYLVYVARMEKDDGEWCLEWPIDYVESPWCVYALTTEIPGLCRYPSWLGLLDTSRKKLIDNAKKGFKEEIKTILTLLELHYKKKRGSGEEVDSLQVNYDELRCSYQSEVEGPLGPRRNRKRGCRSNETTFEDYDSVMVKVFQGNLGENAIRSVAEKSDDFRGESRRGAFDRVTKRVQRSKKRTKIFPYAVVRCDLHREWARAVETPCTTVLWEGIEVPLVSALKGQQTLSFRYRVGRFEKEEGIMPPIPLRGKQHVT